jgi:hypothetical protein
VAQVTVEAQYIADTAQYVKALRTAAQATQALADQIPGQVKAQDNLKKSTEALGQGAEEASKGFTILRNAMGTALGVAAVNLVSNVTGRLKGFAKASFDAAARVEELDIAMNSIGEATGLGADTIKDATTAIRKNGIELAAAQQIAIEFAQNQLDLASASKVARVAQDLAVIAGQNSTATTQLLTQAIITGNSMLLKSAGISRLASEGYAEYAKQIGKSVRQLSAQERQQAVTNLILQEGERVAGTYEGAMNAAGKVLRSFKRIINDIQIEIGKILLNAFGPLIKSTYDLLKAFSASVREGGALSGTLSMLSENFQILIEPLVDFIKNMTESIKSGKGMENIGKSIETIIPPLMTAVETVRALAATYASVLIPALQALTPLFTALASVLTPILNLFTRLPEPIRMVIGLFVLMQIAMAKSATAAKIFGLSWASLRTGFTTGTKTMMVSLKAFEIRIKTAMIKAKTQVGALAAAAKVMSAGVAASFRAMAVAVKGFLLSLGPIGLALIAVTVAFEVLAGKSADTQAKVEALRDTIDETTGAFTELSKQTIMADLRKQFSAEDQQRLRDMGLSVEEMADAIVKGGPAIDAMAQKFNDAITPVDQLNSAIALGQGTLEQTAQRAFGGYAKIAGEALDQTAQAALDNAAAQQRAAQETQISLTQEMAKHKQREQETISSLINMTEAEKQHRDFIIDKTRSMNDVTESAIASIEALDAATQALTEAISAEATYDKARKSIKDLGKSFKDNGKKVKGFSDEALNNRKAIRDAASSYIEYANSLQDPIERQAALEEGQEKITAALERADIDPSKSKILQTLKEEAEQSGETVAEFAAQRDKAAQYGNEVGKNFIDGIIEELAKGKDVAATEAGETVEGMLDAANAAQDARSPSRKAAKVARNFIDGIVKGVKENKRLAEMEVSELGQGMLDALETKMDEFVGKLETAGSALRDLGDLTEGLEAKFGLPTQIEGMFGEGASASGILGGYRQLSGAVQQMFAPMLDEEIVPKKIVRKRQKQMDDAMDELDRLTQFAVDRVKEREALNERMVTLEREYSDKVSKINQTYNDLEKAAADEMKAVEGRFKALQNEINSRYDALDRAAAANIKRIEAHYDQLIPTLEAALKEATAAYDAENKVLKSLVSERDSFLDGISKGFRGFLNNLKVDGDKATRTITRTTEKIVDGIKVLTQESFEEETTGGGFAEALQGRLQSLRDFTSNIRSLLSRGLDPTLVRDFVSAGVDSAGDTVAALASGSNDQIAQINSAQNELGALIEGFQQESSAQWFDYGIAQQQAIVAPLQTAAQEAQLALDQAKMAREQELTAAKAHAEALRLNRQAELAQAQADRDAEVARIQAYQEQLRLDRENELLLAKNAYDKEKKEIEDRLAAIEVELKDNAQKINTTFLNLRAKLLPKMKKFGERIINGLIRGLRNREGALYAKADAIANGIRARIAAAFNFGSPSKVTTKMGEQIAQGLIVGMENETRAVMRAADSLAEAAMVPITMPRMSSLTPGGAAMGRGGAAARAAAGGGSTINVTVNAGMGADGAEVGRQVVEAIRKYERRSGPVFVSAS